jgi:predicted DsbA family dithiol-disulfide isomerase
MSRVRVTEFTDPYCTWCWGAEPVLRRLREVYRDQIAFEYVMGGLAEDFDQFTDPAGDVDSDEEVATHWQAAAQQHGMPVDVSLWREDPPSSTYTACIAYEAAAFQDDDRADAFLRRMREAGVAGGRNLERVAVLADLAAEVGLDVERFREDVDDEATAEAFREDRRTARQHGAASFPTFRLELDGDREFLRGYKPFATFEKVFTEADVDLQRHEPRDVATLVEHFGRVATREVAEIHESSSDEARARLEALVEEGRVRRVNAGSDYFWEPAR